MQAAVRSKRQRFCPIQRVLGAMSLFSCLEYEDRLLAAGGKPREVNLGAPRYTAGNRSIYQEALGLCAASDRDFCIPSQSHAAMKHNLRKWFRDYYAAGSDRQLNYRHGRLPSYDRLPSADFQWLRDILLRERWKDAFGNRRRFPCLSLYRDHLSAQLSLCSARAPPRDPTQPTHDEARLRRLDGLRQQSGLSWATLTETVAAHFGMVKRKEAFKRTRQRAMAQAFCERQLGRQGMIEHYRASKNRKKVCETQRVKWREPRLTGGRQQPERGGCEQRRFDVRPFMWDRAAYQLTASLDGYKVEEEGMDHGLPNYVWVPSGKSGRGGGDPEGPLWQDLKEVLSNDNVGQNCTGLQSIYFFQMILPHYGVIANVAMKSGSRCLVGEEGMLFWMDEFDKYGIPIDANVQTELKAKRWQVCCVIHCDSSCKMCS